MERWTDRPFDLLFHHWTDIQPAPDAVPRKRDIDPGAFIKLLPDVVILEYNAKGDYRYRLAGTAVTWRIEAPLVQTNVIDLIDHRVRRFSIEWIESLFSVPCGAYVSFPASYKSGVLRQIDALHLPLADDRNRVRYLIAYNRATDPLDYNAKQDIFSVGGAEMTVSGIDIGHGLPNLPSKPPPDQVQTV